MRRIILSMVVVSVFAVKCSGPVSLQGRYSASESPAFNGEIVDRYKISAIPVAAPVLLDSIHTAWLNADGQILVFNHQTNDEEKCIGGKEKITGFAFQDTQFAWIEESGKKKFVLYDLRNDDEHWRIPGLPSATNPVFCGIHVISASVGGTIHSYSVSDGEKQWSLRAGGRIFAQPVLWRKTLLVGKVNGELMGINCDGGAIEWRVQLDEPITAMYSKSDYVYIGTQSGEMIAINPETHNVSWKIPTAHQVVNGPLEVGDSLLWGNSMGEVYKIDAITGGSRLFATLKIPFAGPPVQSAAGILLSGLDSNLYLLDKQTGAMKKSLEFDGRLRSAPIFIQSHWYLAAEDHWIYEVR